MNKNDLFELQLFDNPELTAELLFAAIDLEDLIKGIPSRMVKNQLKEYTDSVDSKIATIFRSNKSSAKLHKLRAVNSKFHYSVEEMIRELSERMNTDFSDIMAKAHTSLAWVPEDIFMSFTMVTTRALQFLMQSLPQKPSRSLFGMTTNKFKYSDFDISRFNRLFTIIEDPISILDDLKTGRVTKESIDAMEMIYPEIIGNMRIELTQYFIDKKTKNDDFDITYQEKINLSKFFNTSVSEFLDPTYVNKLQTILKLSDAEATQSEQGGSKSNQAQVPSSGIKQRLNEG